MNWKVWLVLAMVAFVGIGVALQRRPAEKSAPLDKISLVTSFYPLAYLAEKIGGDLVSVTNLTPVGAEPHDFEPTTNDIVTIENSQLLLLHGSGFEPWAEKLETQNQELQIVTIAEGLADIETGEAQEPLDPHVWLDPVLMQAMAQRVLEAISSVDPDNRPLYATNTVALMAELDQLQSDFEAGLKQCRSRTFVTAHDAFGYLARRFNLTQVAIAGLSPDEEPSPRDLAQVSQVARETQAKYIFFETLVDPSLAETVAKEVGAQTLVLNPLEGLTPDDVAAGRDYRSLQRMNLENLRRALDCT